MVGIVIVSHVEKLAQGVMELCSLMTPDVPMAAAGGMEDGGFGTSYEKICAAVDKVYSDDGVALLMDMGSAVMTTEMVLEDMSERKLRMVDCPLVEGAVLAALAADAGQSLDAVVTSTTEAGYTHKLDG